MPPDRRTLRDIRSAYKGMKEYQLNTGQTVAWFRFDQPDTTVHPVYDTGPQRIWYPPVCLPVLLAEYLRARKNIDDDGLYLVDHLHIIMSFDQFFHTQMPDPDITGEGHMNDRIGFDGRLFSVVGFLPQGRVADYFLTISVDAVQVAQSELAEDVAAAMFASYVTVGDSTGGVT
jgi:hypothetical protein